MSRRVVPAIAVITLLHRRGTPEGMIARSGARPWDHLSTATPERPACTRIVGWRPVAYLCHHQRALSVPKALARRRRLARQRWLHWDLAPKSLSRHQGASSLAQPHP